MSTDHIFQILIADPAMQGSAPEPTAQLMMNVDSFRKTYPNAQYRLYEDADIRRFLKECFGARILSTYDRLNPYAFKADLARYCLLFELGGVYSDLSQRHHRPVWAPDTEVSVFRDLPQHPHWAVSNGLIGAPAKRPEFKQIIETIADYADLEFYGHSTLDVTGPYLFGRILAQSSDWKNIHFGNSRSVRNYFPFAKKAVRTRKFMADGTLVACKKKNAHGNISEFNTGNGNNYNELWSAREVWKPK